MDVYVSSVYKYTVNTLWRCISSADFPAARQDQFFHPSCRTMDTAAPLPTSLLMLHVWACVSMQYTVVFSIIQLKLVECNVARIT